jgi:dihydroneopterin aldolase
MMTDREQAAFEAGIKLGALYHQWVGTPISRATAETIENAIASSVALQPYVEEIDVSLDQDAMNPNAFGYSELSGRMFTVAITTRVNDAVCEAALAYENGYPMMRLVSLQ